MKEFKLRARCGRGDIRMRFTSMPQVKVFTCPMCDRVSVISETIMAGDAYEVGMKARGYHRVS